MSVSVGVGSRRLPARCLCDAKAACPQPHDEFAVRHAQRSRTDQFGVALRRNVVVVEIECPLGYAVRACERVQLVERGVADQMRPQRAVVRPHRGVDQDGHAGESTVAFGLSGFPVSGKLDRWCVSTYRGQHPFVFWLEPFSHLGA